MAARNLIRLSNTTKRCLPEKKILKTIADVLKVESHTALDLSVVICGDKFIKKINTQFLNHEYATDTIAFRLNDGKAIDGEIYISADHAETQAHRYKVTFENELFRLIIHATLHLVGYDDARPKEKNRMTLREDFFLSRIK